MPFLALFGGIYFLIVGISGKGRQFKSKMGTPLSAREVKTVKYIYITVGALLLVIALVSGIDFIGDMHAA